MKFLPKIRFLLTLFASVALYGCSDRSFDVNPILFWDSSVATWDSFVWD